MIAKQHQYATPRKRLATKAELRREIGELRKVGRQLANVAFNWAQGKQVLSPGDRELLHALQRDWAAIKRVENVP